MRLHPISFLLGLGAAAVLPLLSRVIRPLAVEATAAGLAAWDEARRVVAEQGEALEDILAEAQSRRVAVLAAANGDGAHSDDEPAAPRRARARRGTAARPDVAAGGAQ